MHLKIHNDVSYINSYGGKSDSIVYANLLTLKKKSQKGDLDLSTKQRFRTL